MFDKREQFREAARECVRLAEITTDLTLKQILRLHAQEWLKLAYAHQDQRLQDLIAGFNTASLAQRQPTQQQQGKLKPDETTEC
jgi:hypothetical protein